MSMVSIGLIRKFRGFETPQAKRKIERHRQKDRKINIDLERLGVGGGGGASKKESKTQEK